MRRAGLWESALLNLVSGNTDFLNLESYYKSLNLMVCGWIMSIGMLSLKIRIQFCQKHVFVTIASINLAMTPDYNFPMELLRKKRNGY